MLSRFLFILTGLLAGIWLRDDSATLFNVGLAALALITLVLAIATAPPSLYRDATGRIGDAYRDWLTAWQRLRSAPDNQRHAAEQELAIASNTVALLGTDRVVKSLQAASSQLYSPTAVASLILDMRRSLRRAGVTLKPADLESLLNSAPAPTNGRHAPTRAPSPASFLG